MTSEKQKESNARYYLKNKASICARQKASYAVNREKILARNKKWAVANRERRLTYFKSINNLPRRKTAQKECYHRNKNKPSKIAYNKQYAKKHALRLRAYWKKYRQDHPDKTKAHNKANWHRRRALLAQASINLAGIKEFIRQTKSKRSFLCYYCQRRIPIAKLHFDHIVSLANGGEHSVRNLCTSCSECNLTKGDKPVHIWIETGQQLLTL